MNQQRKSSLGDFQLRVLLCFQMLSRQVETLLFTLGNKEIEEFKNNPDFSSLKIDFINAFDTVKRYVPWVF